MKILRLLLIPILFVGVIITQYYFDAHKKKTLFVEPLVLNAGIVKATDLGLHNAAADASWLEAIQYLGGAPSKTSEKLPNYLFLSADLDPRFAYPYAFGALILPSFGYTDQAIDLAKRGIADSEPDWRIPYYLATTYHSEKNDPTSAAKYFDIAARTPGAPPNIKQVAATYGSRPDLRERTKQIWVGILETSKDEVVIEQAKHYVAHFEVLDFLETAAKEYKKRNGAFPKAPQDLVDAKILKAIPPDPFGFEFNFDETGRAVIKTQ